MKIFLLLAVLVTGTCSWSQQQVYASLSVGYLYNPEQVEQPYYMVNSYHVISMPWFISREDYSFRDNLHVDLSLGHMINEYVGYEFAASYLKPVNVSGSSGRTQRILSGNFFQGSAKLILAVPIAKSSLYTKLGLDAANGKMTYFQRYRNDPEDPTISTSEATLNYEYKGNFSWGFNGAIGLNIALSKRVSIFGELNAVVQSFTPKTGNTTEFTIDGKNWLIDDYRGPYASRIDFGDENGIASPNPKATNDPQKIYKHAFGLGGYGITLGVKFILWSKKKLWRPPSQKWR